MDSLFGPDFWETVNEFIAKGQRKGQAVWNVSETMYPNETRKLSGSRFDCFYNNSRIKDFMEKVIDLATAP